MSLIKSGELFDAETFPVAVDTVADRRLKSLPLHRHDFFELLYVEKGSLSHELRDSSILLEEGDVFILKPYALHRLGHESGRSWHCSFQMQVVDSSVRKLDDLKQSATAVRYFFKPLLPLLDEGVVAVRFKMNPADRARTAGLLQRLKATVQESGDRGCALTRYHLLNMLTLFAGQLDSNYTVDNIQTAETASGSPPGLRCALNYIHDHFEQPLTLPAIAERCGVTISYFCRLFKNEMGMTFLSYLNRVRIERAQVLLQNSGESALDICYRVGFNNYSCFNRQFKKMTGTSPTVFRKQVIADQFPAIAAGSFG